VDAMTKVKPYQAFKILIDTNKLNLKVTEWVEWDWWNICGSFTACWKTVRFIYGPLEGRTVYFSDRKQDLRPARSTVWKAAQETPREEFPMYFFCVLRFCWSNYGGYTQVVSFFKYRQCLITAPAVPTACLRVRYSSHAFTRRCTNHSLTRLVHL
jgi:hypothetical protein